MSADLTTIRAELEQAQALSEKATDGPWEADLEDGTRGVWPTTPGQEEIIGEYCAADGFDSWAWQPGTDENLRLIAAYRSLAPKLAGAMLAVLNRHRKSPLFDHEDGCENTSEEHREEKHVEWSVGEFYCEDLHAGWTCHHCYEVQDIDSLGEPPAWPCADVQTILDAWGGQDA